MGLVWAGLGWHGGMVTGQLVSIQIPTPRYIQSQNEQNILLEGQPWGILASGVEDSPRPAAS